MQHPVVLVVDDNTDFLAFTETLLAFAGYTVFSCQCFAQALALIQTRKPKVLTLDLRVSETEDGSEFLTALRSNPATSRLPVLVCSADIEALHDVARRNTETHTQVLAKPFDAFQLLDVLQQLIQRAP